jgi:hypothetical protein
MPEQSLPKRVATSETVVQFQKAELTEHARRIGEIEVDLKALIQIVEGVSKGLPKEDKTRALLSSLVEKYNPQQ